MSSVAMNGHDVNAGQTSRERSLGSSGTCSFNYLGTLAELRELNISFVLSGMDGQSDMTDFHEILGLFENLSMKFKSHYNPIRVVGTVYEDLCTFIVVYLA